MSLQQWAAQEGDAEERSGEEHKWLCLLSLASSPSQHRAGKCKHHAGCFVKPDPAMQYLTAQRGALLEMKSQGTQQSGDTKMKMCIALSSPLSEIMLEVIVFLVTTRQATYSTWTSLLRSHSVSALWMIQTPRCWQQGKGAFSPLIVQHTALHLTCCMPSVPALRTKLLTSTVTLLWHFAPQPQLFTMIHLLCQLPVGFLVAILQMDSETKLIFFCQFWELSMRCRIV